MNRKWSLVILFCVQALYAAEPLTLDQCLASAYEHNPDLRAAREMVRQVQGDVLATRGQLLPNLNFSSSYLKQNTAPIAFSAANLRPSFASTDVWEHNFTAKQTLFAWGGLFHQVQSAQWAERVSEEKLRSVQHQVRAQVKRTFYELLLTQQKREIAEEAEEVAKSHYQTTDARYRAAQSSSLERSQARVYWINRQTELIRSRNEIRIAEEKMRKLLGFPDESPLKIRGDFSFKPWALDIDVFKKEMTLHRPDLLAFRYQSQYQESRLRVARAGHRPNMTASFTRLWQSAALSSSWDQYQYWDAMAQINFPLFDGFSSWGKVGSAQAAVDQTEAERQSQMDTALFELKEAVFRASDAKERIEAQKENVAAAKDNLRIATRRYRLGTFSSLALKDAQFSLTEAETLYLQALFDYTVAGVDIERIVGRD